MRGLWRPDPQAQKREVVVSFGDATLMMADVRSLQPLAHWSLPATRRRNPGAMPAIYSPDDAAGEELEIADDTMVAAIAKVHAIIAARQPHPGRLPRRFWGRCWRAWWALACWSCPPASSNIPPRSFRSPSGPRSGERSLRMSPG